SPLFPYTTLFRSLDPLEIDDRHDADQQIHMPRDIDGLAHIRAVQTFVEEHVGVRVRFRPWREGPRVLAVRARFGGVMQVLADSTAAAGAVVTEALRQLLQQIRLRTEMAEVSLAARFTLLQSRAHRLAVIAMERVAFDHRRLDLFAAEHVVEAAHDCGRAGPGGAGHGHDGMLRGHAGAPQASILNNDRSPNSGESEGLSVPASNSAW